MKKNVLMIMGLIVLAAFIALPAYAQTGAADQPGQSDTGMQGGEATQSESGAQGQIAQGPLKASELMGASVQSQQGNDLGKVGDLVLSDTGSVEYLVLAKGGMLGIGSRMVPIPWQQVQQINTQDGENALIVSLDEQRLQNAPSFSKNEWNEVSQSDFEQQVRGYYGEEGEQGLVPPGMEEESGMGGEQGMGAPGGEGMDSDQHRGTDSPGGQGTGGDM